MSLVQRLVDFVRDVTGPGIDPAWSLEVSDDHLAAAALLVHVARVDGGIAENERRALVDLLRSGFGMSAGAAESLVARADRFDREVDDVAALVEMLGHGTAREDKARLLAMAYDVAAADGSVGEFERDLLWRMGGLLGFDEGEIEAVRTSSGRVGGDDVRR